MLFAQSKCMKDKLQKIIVIGNGMVGHRFCENIIKKQGENRKYELLVFGDEKHVAYDRVSLSSYFKDYDAGSLYLATEDWYKENEIDLRLNTRITKISSKEKVIYDSSNQSHTYDKLVLATGSKAFIPPVDGVNSKGVFAYRTIEDLDKISEFAKGVKTGVVIGGGLVGLEAAKALLDLKLKTHVIEFSDRLMPRQLDESGASLLKKKIENIGVEVHLNKLSKTFVTENNSLTSIDFSDNTSLQTDMVVISAGIHPHDELSESGEIEKGARGGFVVDDFLATSRKDIYAIGEAASYRGFCYGLIAPGYDMAEVLASNLMGDEKRFLGADLSTKLKLIGVDVASFGDSMGETEKCQIITLHDEKSGCYKRLNVTEDGKYLVGGILVGDISEYGSLLQVMKNNITLPESPLSLITTSISGDQEAMPIPESAVICSCNNVTKGEIRNAIQADEISDIAEVKKCTNAGTGCGGCMPDVTSIFNQCLIERGQSVKQSICEHFDYTRAELYQIVKATNIQTFEELLEKKGTGSGCEVCKPAIASIFATAYNDLVPNHANIQDTNDRYLANIQKNGTYSIVPRIAGGEILPAQLIVLGEVAKKYSLYLKITGAQRIDLFGAQLNDLPNIWEELIEAGFESGHAYAKGLRTVKSCVGSSWCRYGVQDSVSFAIAIENRYKGIRAPHKFKGAVTGCLRQCAEVDNKDFGVIATEKGWNLFVAGNGGAKPQSAKLLASDLSEEECIRYIDRFLMYYITTAKPLQRTATWFNDLEGGIEHLREVIVKDSLGINAELESQMQGLIDAYECEWKAVVQDPKRRALYKHFANSEEINHVEFVDERGQKVPAKKIGLVK